MRVVVSGAGGFVGREVIKQLAATDCEVVGIYRQDTPDPEAGHGIMVSDLAEAPARNLDLDGFDVAVHCAGLAHQPYGTAAERFNRQNVIATENLAVAAAASGVRRFIHISSVSVYGNTGYHGMIDENTESRPADAYAKSKFDAEAVLERVFGGTETDLVILRPATVIGEGDPGNIATLIRLIDRRRFVFIGDGANLKSFLHKSDLARAVSVIASMPEHFSGIYNVTAPPIPVSEAVRVIYEELGRKVPAFRIPGGMLKSVLTGLTKIAPVRKIKSASSSINKWMSDDAYSGAKLSAVFVPGLTAAEALKREVAWYKRNK